MEYKLKHSYWDTFREFVLLFILTMGSLLIFSMIGLRLTTALYNVDYYSLISNDYSESSQNIIAALKFLNFFTTLGTFIVPVILIPIILKQKPLEFLKMNKAPGLIIFVQVTALLFFLYPFLEWLIGFNSNLHLPEFMGSLDEWLRSKEAQETQLTKLFLNMPTAGQMFSNLLLVALAPAILEELFFRGLVQKLVNKWLGNIHFAIIFTSIFFSAVHLSFSGFLPRFLLGFIFGYLFYWTGNIWTTVFAHFLNNAAAVLLVFIAQKGFINYQIDKPMNNGTLVIIICFGVFAAFFLLLAKYYARKRDKTDDWVNVYSTNNVSEAEIIKGKLENEGINSVIVNKRDSSYVVFGPVEVFVNPEDSTKAKEIISKIERSEPEKPAEDE
jgi:uncharacterized protein